MKVHILLIGLWLGATTTLFAQEKPQSYKTHYEVQYEVTYHPDTTHLDKSEESTLYLYTGKKYSVFMTEGMAKREKAREKAAKERNGKNISMVVRLVGYNFNKTIYKNLQTSKVYVVGDLGGHKFAYTDPHQLQWKLEDSSKTFMGYTVNKATTHFAGRDYVAWYTLQVPISDGPYVFQGLPGLIVDLYDTRKDYHFALQSLIKLKYPKIWKPKEAQVVTRKEYRELVVKARKNGANNLSNQMKRAMEKTMEKAHATPHSITSVRIKKVSTIASGVKGRVDYSNNGALLIQTLKDYKQTMNNPIELK